MVTDLDGNYTLNLPENTKVLVFSYTGFLTKEVGVEASNTLDVVMEEDTHFFFAVTIITL